MGPIGAGWMKKSGRCCSPGDRRVRRHFVLLRRRKCECRCGGKSGGAGGLEGGDGGCPVRGRGSGACVEYSETPRFARREGRGARPHTSSVCTQALCPH